METLETLQRFVGGQMSATIEMDEVRMDIRAIRAPVEDERLRPQQARVVFEGDVWKRPQGMGEWVRSTRRTFVLELAGLRDQGVRVYGQSEEGFLSHADWVIYPPGDDAIVVGFTESTLTIEDVLREHGEIELDVVAQGNGFTCTNVLAGGKRIGISTFAYHTRFSNVWSTGIRQASLVGGMVEVSGWLKLESGGMAFGSRPISGSGATVLEAIKNAYGE